MSRRWLVSLFAHEEDIFGALASLRSAGYAIREVYAPYAAHGLDRAAGLRRSRIGFVTVAAAAIGSTVFYFFQDWASAVSWPLNIGGKPFSSAPAWIPVVFEAGVLTAGLTTVVAMLIRSRLYPGRKPRLVDPRVTDDRFAVVLEIPDSGFDLDRARSICRRHNAESIDEGPAQEPPEKPRKPPIRSLEVWRWR